MYAKLFGLLLFACQIILNSSSVIRTENLPDEIGRPSTVRPNTRLDGYAAFSDVNAAYKIFQEPTTWTEARDRCVANGAKLAITDSLQKIRHIVSLKRDEYKWLHVGIHKLESTDQWVRVDNDLPVTSVPWRPDNPDGSGNCAGISLMEDGLVDYRCDFEGEHYVCEKPLQDE